MLQRARQACAERSGDRIDNPAVNPKRCAGNGETDTGRGARHDGGFARKIDGVVVAAILAGLDWNWRSGRYPEAEPTGPGEADETFEWLDRAIGERSALCAISEN